MVKHVRHVRIVAWRSERGAGVVEVALILPVLMALVLGLITGGIAYQRKITITDAVREGARYGATFQAAAEPPYSLADLTKWSNAVKKRVEEISGGEIDDTDVTLCAELVLVVAGTPNTACGVQDPNGAAGTYVGKVSYSKDAKLEAFFFSSTLTLRSQAAARYEREES